jgi:hypothetical protein
MDRREKKRNFQLFSFSTSVMRVGVAPDVIRIEVREAI